MLLDNGAEVNAVNIHGQNSLHILVLHTSDAFNLGEGLARLLLDRGVNLNGRDKDEITPLHMACYNGHVGIAMMLLDYGAQSNAEDIRGQTPLHQVLLGNPQLPRPQWLSTLGPSAVTVINTELPVLRRNCSSVGQT